MSIKPNDITCALCGGQARNIRINGGWKTVCDECGYEEFDLDDDGWDDWERDHEDAIVDDLRGNC